MGNSDQKSGINCGYKMAHFNCTKFMKVLTPVNIHSTHLTFFKTEENSKWERAYF